MSARLRQLVSDRSGSAIIEFGILAPAIITLLFGVVQVGLWMHTYNALRSVAAESGRYVAVEYQKSNKISNVSMASWARDRAISTYKFDGSQLSTSVVDSSTQSIAGVTEKTLTLNYTMNSFMGIVGIDDIPVSFSRPIFVKTI
ncbi:MAG: TadE/TadG family type IV pilus assembly protein [Novosphingobium sp.]|nr:TadE/TadG family type IV pilus assembly protein [Novosphingobium sp.]